MLESYRSEQPSPSLGVVLSTEVLRYYAVLRLPAPPEVRDWRSSHCPTSCDHRTRQGLTGSIAVLSLGAIPKHPTGYAAVLLVPFSLSGSDTLLNRRISRLHQDDEGSPPPSGHHGFTVRYGPKIWLRPIRFWITPDTLPLSPTALERVNLHGSDFH